MSSKTKSLDSNRESGFSARPFSGDLLVKVESNVCGVCFLTYKTNMFLLFYHALMMLVH